MHRADCSKGTLKQCIQKESDPRWKSEIKGKMSKKSGKCVGTSKATMTKRIIEDDDVLWH